MVKQGYAIAVLFVLCAGGCAGLHLKSPEARVRDVRLTDQTEQGARVVVTVELTNPNSTPLPLREADYRVTVGQGAGGAFSFSERLDRTLPGNGTQTVTLPAAFARDHASFNGATYNVRGSVSYEPPGELRRMMTDTGIPLPSAGFSGDGRLE